MKNLIVILVAFVIMLAVNHFLPRKFILPLAILVVVAGIIMIKWPEKIIRCLEYLREYLRFS